jgi:hypothetical protein
MALMKEVKREHNTNMWFPFPLGGRAGGNQTTTPYRAHVMAAFLPLYFLAAELCIFYLPNTVVNEQCVTGNMKIGTISNADDLKQNLTVNCIPNNVDSMTVSDYDDFLLERRKMMALKIKEYYNCI